MRTGMLAIPCYLVWSAWAVLSVHMHVVLLMQGTASKQTNKFLGPQDCWQVTSIADPRLQALHSRCNTLSGLMA
jgi:hypothetical protein